MLVRPDYSFDQEFAKINEPYVIFSSRRAKFCCSILFSIAAVNVNQGEGAEKLETTRTNLGNNNSDLESRSLFQSILS